MTNKPVKIDRRRKAVLILECDSDKLTQQNLALGDDLQKVVKQFFPKNPIHIIKSCAEADLLESVAALCKTGQLCRNIIVIGHSNRRGLKISADRFISWEGVANWINPFEPHRVILLACEAGHHLPCTALFGAIPMLKEIFASPVTAHKNQQYIVFGKVLHVLGTKKENLLLNQVMQLGNIIFTRGVMLSRSRENYESD